MGLKMNILLRIKELLKRRNWTIYKLSKLSGVSQSTLSNLFKRNNAPTISTLESICKTFGITLSQFFSNDDVFSLDAEQKNILEITLGEFFLTKEFDQLEQEIK